MSECRYWVIEYERYTSGPEGDAYTEREFFWGTWYEAARKCVSSDESAALCRYKWRRKVTPLEFPAKKRKIMLLSDRIKLAKEVDKLIEEKRIKKDTLGVICALQILRKFDN